MRQPDLAGMIQISNTKPYIIYCGIVLIAHHGTSCLKKVDFLQTVFFPASRKEKLYSTSLDAMTISVVNADYKAPSLILRFGMYVFMYVCASSNDSPLGYYFPVSYKTAWKYWSMCLLLNSRQRPNGSPAGQHLSSKIYQERF